MKTLNSQWWKQSKKNYVFDKDWFKAFEKIDPKLAVPTPKPDGKPNLGKMGVVLWHGEDGKTITPVGITYFDNNEFTFCYHPDYVDNPNTQPISHQLPKTKKPYKSQEEYDLLPYFDNLIAEGWLGMLQYNVFHEINKDQLDPVKTVNDFYGEDDANERYKRLLTFGRGFHGAISVVDAMASDNHLKIEDYALHEAIQSYSAIGGAQPKMLATEIAGQYYPAQRALSITHIAKLPGNTKGQQDDPISPNEISDIVKNEYLNLTATRALLPEDETAEAVIDDLQTPRSGGAKKAENSLLIKRFDRLPSGGRKHFEEATQLMGLTADQKYEANYKQLADLTRELTGEAGVKRVFKRLLGQLIMGNADNHLKNFAFWKKEDGTWDLTPNYDLLSTDRYDMSELALKVNGEKQFIHTLDMEGILALGKEFGFSPAQVRGVVDEIKERMDAAKEAVMAVEEGYITHGQKERFCELLDFRFNRQLSGFYEGHQKHASRDGEGKLER